ncbi:MAG: hypothetical protein HKP61_12310, partial [Dactylosporangium sp.]|nr:hypothetical protein [Dactylosporangium sp.]NNJ61702.1 hypothetical protein [Dactylosporangium sp.]
MTDSASNAAPRTDLTRTDLTRTDRDASSGDSADRQPANDWFGAAARLESGGRHRPETATVDADPPWWSAEPLRDPFYVEPTRPCAASVLLGDTAGYPMVSPPATPQQSESESTPTADAGKASKKRWFGSGSQHRRRRTDAAEPAQPTAEPTAQPASPPAPSAGAQ